MEAETTTAPAATGGEAALGNVDFQAILDGANPESVLSQGQPEVTSAEPTPTPEGQEPSTEEAEVQEPVETKTEEKPADQTAEEFSEPLPGKLGKLLEAVAKTSPDLARQIRADHEALNGPEGFRGMFRTVEEAKEYKTVAPTVEDLKVMADYSQRYDNVDKQYVNDPKGLLRTLAQDPQRPGAVAPEFERMAQVFEPSLRELNNPQLYEAAARPFNQNFWQNVMSTVQREGTPEEQELFKAFEQKYLGQMTRGPQPWNGQQQNPAQSELETLRAERETFQHQQQEAFFNDAKASWTESVNTDLKKYLEEKMGSSIPKDVRDDVISDAVREAAPAIWKVIDGNPLVKSRLAGVIDGGDRSPQHKKAVIDAVLAYAKPQIQAVTAPVIRKWLGRAKAMGGNSNAPKTTTTNNATKDVGSGSPTVGTARSGLMPKGAPPGFNNMKPEDRNKFINWKAMGEDALEAVILADQTGDWSKVVIKGT